MMFSNFNTEDSLYTGNYNTYVRDLNSNSNFTYNGVTFLQELHSSYPIQITNLNSKQTFQIVKKNEKKKKCKIIKQIFFFLEFFFFF